MPFEDVLSRLRQRGLNVLVLILLGLVSFDRLPAVKQSLVSMMEMRTLTMSLHKNVSRGICASYAGLHSMTGRNGQNSSSGWGCQAWPLGA